MAEAILTEEGLFLEKHGRDAPMSGRSLGVLVGFDDRVEAIGIRTVLRNR